MQNMPAPVLILFLAIAVLTIASTWVVFTKAGKPGWAAIVPVYNIIVLCEIAGRPGWHAVFLFIPFANIVFAFLIYIDVAKVFGKSAGFGVGLVLLSFIFLPMLAFGDAKYEGAPAAA